MKKALLLLLVLSLFLVLPALADTNGYVYDDWYGGIVEYTGTETDLVIPSVVDGHALWNIGDNFLCDNETVTSVVIPEGVSNISYCAFNYCSALKSLTLPESLRSIDSSAMQNMSALEEITFPAGLMIIGSNSLMDCASLRSVTFTGVPPILESGALCWLPDDVVFHVPADYVDEYTALLSDCVWDLHIESTGNNAVIVNTDLPESDFTFDASTGTITRYNGHCAAFSVPSQINGVPVKAIGEKAFASAFSGSVELIVCVIPEGVETIGSSAFEGSNLRYLTLPSTLREIGEYAFSRQQISNLVLPDSLETIGSYAFTIGWLSGDLVLPDSLRYLGDYAFSDTIYLDVLTIPSTIEYIGAHILDDARVDTIRFKSDTFPALSAETFANISSLDYVELPWNASCDSMASFESCFESAGITCTVCRANPLSAGVATLPRDSSSAVEFEEGLLIFYDDDVESLTLWDNYAYENVTGLGEGVFAGNQTLRAFYPHHRGWFETIGAQAFEGSSVSYVEMFDSILAVGSRAFADCVNLTEITLPVNLEAIAADVFEGCSALSSVRVDCDLSALPNGLFDGCPVTSVTFSATMTVKQARAEATRLGVSESAVLYNADGTEIKSLTMTYAETNPADFWIDPDFNRLDHYQGYELNLYLPREKDGTALQMLSANTLSRAMSNDGYSNELPVISVVIPENYTELVYGSLSNIPTLETLIIYSNIGTLDSCIISNCPALREVIFVNGLDAVKSYAFDGCPALETVYLGADCQISENAFSSSEPTILTALPDLDALLDAVKRDPITPPAEPETLTPSPITDPDASAYLGIWYVNTISMDGVDYAPSDLGMNYVFTLNEDGTVTLTMGDENDTTVWKMEDGQAQMSMDYTTYSPIFFDEAGNLILEDGSVRMVLSHEQGESTVEPITDPEAEKYFGTWNLVRLSLGDAFYDAADFGMSMSLVLSRNGAAEIISDGESDFTFWRMENDVASLFAGSYYPLPIDENGFLTMDEDGAILCFERADGDAPAAPSTPVTAAPETDSEYAEYLGTWYAIAIYQGGGKINPKSTWGLTITLQMNADGTYAEDFNNTNDGTWAYEAEYDGLRLSGGGLDGYLLRLDEDGRMSYGNASSGGMVFSRDADDILPDEPAATSVPTAAPAAPVAASLDDYLNVNFVCTSATSMGYPIDMSYMGDFKVTFGSSGLANLTISGAALPGMAYTADDSGFHVDYYGMALDFTFVEGGLQLLYGGSMLLTYVPEN